MGVDYPALYTSVQGCKQNYLFDGNAKCYYTICIIDYRTMYCICKVNGCCMFVEGVWSSC